MNIVYVGVDLGSSNFHQVAVNEAGVRKVNREFATSEANLIKAFADQRGEIHVHLEAGELAPWAISIIRPLVSRVVCSHPQSNASTGPAPQYMASIPQNNAALPPPTAVSLRLTVG